jgi:hypothetical protein
MKCINCLPATFIVLLMASFQPRTTTKTCYESKYVEISQVKYEDNAYNIVYMKRDSSRVNAKYFAAKDFNGKSVYQRYSTWAASKNIILVSSGTYMDNTGRPVGLTIDNGVLVNNTMADFDGLVIVYATGGIVVSNLDDKDLTVQGIEKKLDIRNSAFDRQTFIEWAKNHEATVFQTHLLVHKNVLTINPGLNGTNSRTARERRFLAVGTDKKGKTIHCIVHCTEYATLYDGTARTKTFLNEYKDLNVTFMINLDTGNQDVFELYNKNCTVNQSIKGRVSVSRAINLLAYYFQ